MMPKPSIFKIILYLFTKYFVLAFILAFIGDRFKILVLDKAHSTHDIVTGTLGYIAYIFFFTCVASLLPMLLFYGMFRLNSIWLIVPGFLVILFLEYCLYSNGIISPVNTDALLSGLLTIVFFPVFFWKYLVALFQKDEEQVQ